MRPDARPVSMFDLVSELLTAAELRALLVEVIGDSLSVDLTADSQLVDIVVCLNEAGGAPAGLPTGLVDKLIERFPEHEIEIIEASASVHPPLRLDGIGLALSGVGFRAAAYHLGALDLLERVGLRERVVRLSTVSGGTLLGVGYAQRAGKAEFQYVDFANVAMDFLSQTDIGAASLAGLRGGASSLVVAAARAYGNTGFIGSGTLAEVQVGAGKLEQVSFNASDLVVGLPFRFVRAADGQRRQGGNRKTCVSDEALSTLYLADIAAVSSCAPVTFEPMLYPRDFRGSPDAPSSASGAVQQTALTDGGVLDSQALDGLRLGQMTGPDPHLVIVCDSTPMQPLLAASAQPSGWGGPPTIVPVAALFGAWAWCVWLEWTTSSVGGALGEVHAAIAAVLALAGPVGLLVALRAARRLCSWLPVGWFGLIGTLLHTPVFKLVRLFQARSGLLGILPAAALQLRARCRTDADLNNHAAPVLAASFCGLADAADAAAVGLGGASSPFLRELVARVGAEDSQLRFESPDAAFRARACGYATLCRALGAFLYNNRWSATAESERVLAWLTDEWARINKAENASELLGE